MRPMILTRIYRRCIVKYFGSFRNLAIWVSSVLFTVFLLDSYILDGVVPKSKIDSDGSLKKPADDVVSRNLSCGQAMSCLVDQYSFTLRSGVGGNGQPTICFNGHKIFSPEKKNGKRGICLVKINGKTTNIEDVRTFDTHENDEILQRYLKLGVDKEDIILISSVNDASLHLSSTTKQLIQSFGSTFINDLEFRDAFVMIGQRNLAPPSKAIEQLIKRRDGEVYASESSIEGCLSIPLGFLHEPNDNSSSEQILPVNEPQIEDKVKLGDHWINCGLPEKCSDDSFPVHIYTGNRNIELPKICFRNRYVVSSDLNNPGRGIVVVVVDSSGGAVLDVQRFDTYENADNSIKMEQFLLNLKNNEMIIALAHDEAKTALSSKVMDILISFGSNFIKELNFRDVWTFVGRANLLGFSPYEDIESAGKDTWPYPIATKLCIKKNFKGRKEKIDLNLMKNVPRRTFCKIYDGHEDFCAAQNVDIHPKVLPLTNQTFENPVVYKVPIVLIPGLSQVSTVKQLEALFMVPGLDLNYVVMMSDEKFEEAHSIASLFNVTVRQLKSTTKYMNLMIDALDLVWIIFPSAKYAIFLEEEVIPNADILSFFGQCLNILEIDDSLAGVSAFNEHGFEMHSQRPELVYRGRTFPGSGFMLKKSFYGAHMVNKMPECCGVRSWFGWNLPESYEVLIPDVSRTTRRVYLGLTEHAEFIREYFNKPRLYSNSKPLKLQDLSSLTKSAYRNTIEKIIRQASTIPNNDLKSCVQIPGLKLTKGMYSVFFEQNNTFAGLAKCFDLLNAPTHGIRGAHEHTLRFTYLQAEVILIGDKSPYYKLKPQNQQSFV